MENIVTKAIQSAQQSEVAFTKFITPNDTGATGGHQAGYHIHKNSWQLFFDSAGVKGSNEDKFVTIKWQGDFETSSRFIYYGVGTRNEYRLTRFGKGFPFLTDDNVGDLLILCKESPDYYAGYVLQSDEDIENFFAALNISSNETNCIIPKQFQATAEENMMKCFWLFINSLTKEFPTTYDLSANARRCFITANHLTSEIIKGFPDRELMHWVDAEFQLFKVIENDRYSKRITTPFATVEELIEFANTILNRRKSRAGKSLEHHLSEIFSLFQLKFAPQGLTEDRKRPDFLFPNEESYNNSGFDGNKLVMLAAKTTCKDRWRQVLNEADKIKVKHLFTLQPAISKSQLDEMYKSNVCLVVPESNLSTYPKEYTSRIFTLKHFVDFVCVKQS
jgi:type II restriction enzyme